MIRANTEERKKRAYTAGQERPRESGKTHASQEWQGSMNKAKNQAHSPKLRKAEEGVLFYPVAQRIGRERGLATHGDICYTFHDMPRYAAKALCNDKETSYK